MEVEATVQKEPEETQQQQLPQVSEIDDMLVNLQRQFRKMQIQQEEVKEEIVDRSILYNTVVAIEEQDHVNFAIVEDDKNRENTERWRLTQALMESKRSIFEEEERIRQESTLEEEALLIESMLAAGGGTNFPTREAIFEEQDPDSIPDEIKSLHEDTAAFLRQCDKEKEKEELEKLKNGVEKHTGPVVTFPRTPLEYIKMRDDEFI